MTEYTCDHGLTVFATNQGPKGCALCFPPKVDDTKALSFDYGDRIPEGTFLITDDAGSPVERLRTFEAASDRAKVLLEDRLGPFYVINSDGDTLEVHG